MRILDAISLADARKPNAYTNDEKTRWLSEVEGDIGLNILLLCHESIPEYTDYDSDKEKVLMIRPPYDKIYVDWLIAKIDLANAEYSLYANSLAVYNADYDSLSKWVALRVHPADRKAIWHGYYLIGERGEGIEILGLYDTLEDLEEAHPVGEKGNVYAVGTAASNVLYVWQTNPVNEETPGEWVSIGSLKGADGVSPTLDISENGTWVINGEDTGVLADVNRISEDVEAWKNEAASSASDAGDAKDRAESAENAANGYAGQALTHRNKAEEYSETSLASASAAVASADYAAYSASAASSSATEAAASASSAASSASAAEASAQAIEDLTVSATALPEGSDPTVTKTGGGDDPYNLDFGIPKGDTGEKGDTGDTGATGNGIESITKTSTEGLVDTYTITFTDGTTTTFTVTNGADGAVLSINGRTGDVTGLAEESEVDDIRHLRNPIEQSPGWRGYYFATAYGAYQSTTNVAYSAYTDYVNVSNYVGQNLSVKGDSTYTREINIFFLKQRPSQYTGAENLIRHDTLTLSDGDTFSVEIPEGTRYFSLYVRAKEYTEASAEGSRTTTSVLLTKVLFSDYLDTTLTSTDYPAQGKAVGDAISRLNAHHYTARWNKTDAAMTRLNDAAHITTDVTNFCHRGSVNPNYNNPFDKIYPWSGRKLCNIDINSYRALSPGQSITRAVKAWEGDTDFSYTDVNGVWVYTPEFWGKSWDETVGSTEYRYFDVADKPCDGYVHYQESIEGRWHGRTQTVNIGGEDKTCLIPSVGMPAKSIAMSTLHDYAKNWGATLDSIFSIDANDLLMIVEYATMNSQIAIGSGVTSMFRHSSDLISAAETESTVVKISKSAGSAFCIPGAIFDIGTANGGTQVGSFLVVSAVTDTDDDTLLDVTLNAPVTVTTSNYWSVHGMGNTADFEIGSHSGYIGTNGKSIAYYRGEELFGNMFFYILGAYRQTETQHVFIAHGDNDADATDALDASLHIDTGIALSTTSGYIKKLGTLSRSGLLCCPPFCTEKGGDSDNPVGDYHYTNASAGNTVLMRGCHANSSAYVGAFGGYWAYSAAYNNWGYSARPRLLNP